LINEIISWWERIIEKEKPDVLLIEIGGTVGDIENSWFIEAARLLKNRRGSENVMYIHLTYVPFLHSVGEPKTKPAQRDVALLHEKGIIPDALLCRSKEPLSQKIKEKMALFCDIPISNIITAPDIESIYEIPLKLKAEGILELVNRKFNTAFKPDLRAWEELVNKIKNPQTTTTIAICGKYTALKDSYASIIEALTHAGAHCNTKIECKWIETTDIENNKLSVEEALKGVQGVLVPGGFGFRGAEGKIKVIKYARENKIPYLGLCYGLQLAIVEFARNVCNLENANSSENVQTPHPVIDLMPEQKSVTDKGATMRLGAYTAELKPGTLIANLYKTSQAVERHRHRYEVNPA
jgi:CTP synthase